MAKLIGTNPEQVPTNASLGDMAYKDGENLQAGPLTITDGKVGVNNTDPTSPLHVEGTIQARLGASGVQVYGTGGSGEVASVGSLPLVFNVNASPKMTILSSGNVGIGTQSPTQKLDVNGVVNVGDGNERLNISFDGSARINNKDNSPLVFSTTNTQRMSIEANGEVKIATGLLELNGNDIGGTQVTIAEDAVASITPPRTGGFMFITCRGETTYPQAIDSGVFYYDVGASLQLNRTAFAGVGGNMDVVTTDLTGTTGVDGRTTISAQSGVIKIENRLDGASNFQITFL